MNTTAAATEAHVTVATIRTWCRRGVVAAAKVAGRWVIDQASLAARIAIGAMKKPAPKPVVFTTENMVAIGGNRWQKNGMDRVYFNDWAEFAGLEISRYRTGNISSASLGGRGIANGRAGALLGKIEKLWFDASTGRLHARTYGDDLTEVRYLDGERDHVDLFQLATAGIRRAVAAL
ncbi:helix-turn-helix domain-containing protein [Streptomyces sp. NPDC004783]|uniref:helix-turn-helix domain-containing protein n=1 Tax=Streptomyces sp. NPDC004783 TaxID=3154459 RepID=UPI0033A4AF78